MSGPEQCGGLYAVMGSPVTHSLSPDIHTRFAEQARIRLRYRGIDTSVEKFPATLAHFKQAGGMGANVTLPCKRVAWEIAGRSSERARRAQAANTLWWDSDDLLYADNTDGIGLIRDIQENWRFPLCGRRVLVLGAGGAAWGIVGPLLDSSPAAVSIYNRTPERAEQLADAFTDEGPVCHVDQARLRETVHDVIINCTAASLTDALPAALPEKLPAPHLCYDLSYRRDHDTAFVRWGKQQGAKLSVDGLGMLVEQAAEAFFLWHGLRPATHPILEKLRRSCPE